MYLFVYWVMINENTFFYINAQLLHGREFNYDLYYI